MGKAVESVLADPLPSASEPPAATPGSAVLPPLATTPPATTPPPAEPPPGSWRCPRCSELIEASFGECWQCRTQNPASDGAAADVNGSEDQEPPRPALACARCGSTQVIPDQVLEDQGENSSGALHAVVFARPKAWIFKGALRGKLLADICGACGHVELHVGNPGELYAHHRSSLPEKNG